MRTRLLRELWGRDERYYELARVHVQEAAGLGREYDFVRQYLPPRGVLLEIGCGEGSNVDALSGPGRRFVGCDLSRLALGIAFETSAVRRRQAFRLRRGRGTSFHAGKLRWRPCDLGTRASRVSRARALRDDRRAPAGVGRLILVSPQYGAALGASPCRRGGGALRFVRRFVEAHLPRRRDRGLRWEAVHPLVLEGEDYDGDRDTVVEPDLRSLREFLRGRGIRIDASTSGLEWYSWNEQKAFPIQRVIRAAVEGLGRLGLPPYRDLGPLVAVAGTKRDERNGDG